MGVFSVGDIFVSILCFLMCVFFYLIGNLKRLEKIKKYGEKLIGEIKELADSIKMPLENFRVDLEVETTAAEQLLFQLKDVRVIISGYEETMVGIEKRLDQFQTLLSRLDQESVTVEENLLRIRDESAFVDRVFGKIVYAQKQFDALEGDIGLLKESMLSAFEKANADNLEKSVVSLTDVAQKMMTSLQDEVTQNIDALMKTADKVKECVESHLSLMREMEERQRIIIEESKEEVLRLAENAVKMAEEHSGEYEIQLFQRLREEVDKKLMVAHEQIESDWETIQRMSTENRVSISALSEESQLAILKVSEEIEDVRVNIHDTIVRTVEEEETLWRGKLSDIKNEFNLFLERTAELEERVKITHEQIGGTVEKIEVVLKKSCEDAIENATKFSNDKFNQYYTTLDEKFDVTKDKFDAFSKYAVELKEQIEMMQGQINKMTDRIEETLKDSLESAVENAVQLSNEKFDAHRIVLEEKLGIAKNEIDQFAEFASEMERRVNVMREQVSDTVGNFEETLKKSFEKAVQDAESFGDEKFNIYSTMIEEKLNIAKNEINQFVQYTAEMEEQIKTTKEQINGMTEKVEKILKESLETAIENATRLGDGRFDMYRVTLEKKLDVVKSEFDKFSEHATEVEEYVNSMRGQIGGMVENFEETLKKLLEKAAQDAGELGNEKFNNYRAMMEEKLNVAKSEIEQFAKHTTEIEEQVNTMREQIGSTVGSFEEILRESLENAVKEASENAGKFGDEKLDHYCALLEDKISMFSVNTDKKLQDTNDSLSVMIEQLNTLVQNTGEEISESIAVMRADTDKVRANIESLTTEFETLKEEATANLTDKISSLEESVTASLYDRIETLKSIQEAEYTKFDAEIAEKYQAEAKETGEKWTSKFERLREKLETFENTLHGEIKSVDENFSAYRNNIEQNMEELHKNTEMILKNEMEKIVREANETLHMSRRELDDRLKILSTDVQGQIESTRVLIEETGAKSEAILQEANEKIETTMQKIVSLDAEIQNAQKKADDFLKYTKLFEQANNLKIELEHKIENMKVDIERLIQEKNALAGMEMQFEKVRRIEEDVSAKVTRFLAEQKRIDIMESDFNRLVKMSSDIEEKLKGISAENEMLEQVQVKIRKLYEAAEASEEKYQRVEKRNNIIETTNAGISANFKKLDEAERQIETHKADMLNIEKDISSVKEALAKIKFENNEALKISTELSVLDTSLTEIEGRINKMQTAREWLASIETRMNEMYRNTIENLKRIDENSKRSLAGGHGKVDVLSPSLRDEVRRLKQEGWRVETIARNLGISEGEVQLILEVSAR